MTNSIKQAADWSYWLTRLILLWRNKTFNLKKHISCSLVTLLIVWTNNVQPLSPHVERSYLHYSFILYTRLFPNAHLPIRIAKLYKLSIDWRCLIVAIQHIIFYDKRSDLSQIMKAREIKIPRRRRKLNSSKKRNNDKRTFCY